MSFNGSGTFVVNTAGQPVVPNTVISATAFNALTADLANGLSTCITKDGQTTPTANIPMGNNKITGLAPGTSGTDAANLSQVQGSTAKLLQSVTGTDTITAAMVPALTAYAAGQMFYFVAAGDNTGAVTINIDSLGAKSVTRDGSVALVAGDILSGEIALVVYDGTRFQLLNGNSFTNLNVSNNFTLSGGTANGVLYLNGSKVATSGSALAFDGTNFGVGTAGNAINHRSVIYFAGVNAVYQMIANGSTGLGATNGLRIGLTAAGLGELYAPTSLTTYIDNSTATTLTSTTFYTASGINVGIGTASPGYKLDVRGVTASGNGTITTGFSYDTRGLVGTFSNHALGFITNGASPTMLLDTSGNLGIGTTSPSSRLDVRGQETTNYNTVVFGNGTDNQFLNFLCGRALTNGTAAGVASSLVMTLRSSGTVAGELAFATGNDERGRFDQNGSFLVGATANPNVLNRSVVIDSGASSLAGIVLQNNTTGRASTDGSHVAIAGADLKVVNLENAPIIFATNGTDRAQITGAGNFVAGASAALATTATDGFLYVPTCAGTPTGVPTAITGMAPIVVNTTNNKLYFYSGGSWRDAGP